MPASELEFLDVDLSVELDRLGLEDSFFRLYELSHEEKEAAQRVRQIAATRLALNTLVGEKQQQMVGKFNECIAEIDNLSNTIK